VTDCQFVDIGIVTGNQLIPLSEYAAEPERAATAMNLPELGLTVIDVHNLAVSMVDENQFSPLSEYAISE
jgi:hypothetical protein